MPFALSSRKYLLDIDGADIAERTISEIRDQGYADEPDLSVWQEKLLNILPNVTDGTRLTAVRDKIGHTIFYHDGNWIGEIDDRAFTRRFFDMAWRKTPRPALRRALLGGCNRSVAARRSLAAASLRHAGAAGIYGGASSIPTCARFLRIRAAAAFGSNRHCFVSSSHC